MALAPPTLFIALSRQGMDFSPRRQLSITCGTENIYVSPINIIKNISQYKKIKNFKKKL